MGSAATVSTMISPRFASIDEARPDPKDIANFYRANGKIGPNARTCAEMVASVCAAATRASIMATNLSSESVLEW